MNSSQKLIRFGTDGWRAVISEDFTFDNVRKVASSINAYALKKSKKPVIAIGYDTRFLSKDFAKSIANVLSRGGCEVILSDSFVSTPCLSLNTFARKASLGIMISASHNPSEYNGIKIKISEGCSAPESLTKEVESNISAGMVERSGGSTKEEDFVGRYLARVISEVDIKSIKQSNIKLVVDPMHGAGIGYVKRALKATRANCIQIHSNADPLFGGIDPEPVERNLSALKNEVVKTKAACGLATDGDADRIGVVDEKGRYLSPHQVFPLLLHYLCKCKGLKGKVVQTISLGYVSERIARDFNLEFEEVPVGFKYIAEKILKENIVIGGEESGGYGYGSFIPERDGVLNSLVIVEMLAKTKKKLSVLLSETEKEYGKSRFLRADFKNPGIPKDEFVKTLKSSAPDKIAGLKVKQIKDYDGIEFVLEDDSWLLMRPSGTEPIIRVYSETPEIEKTKRLIAWGARRLVLY